MIKKCDFKGCDKAGICRAPRDRDLKSYYHFCREHAAEYNKNWNYYAGLSADEIEAEWERDTFGSASKDKDKAAIETAEYLDFLNNFLSGRDDFDRATKSARPAVLSVISAALAVFGLPATASWREVQSTYRRLAKQYHPDTAKKLSKSVAAEKFTALNAAYKTLEKHFKKK
ncbi:MAG: J domain-containing protein [Alphaproteobacteria bacterium]|nr:J domain-containing protein [Alphaproteobacteria bacterium]MCL2890154.1 J domain-containing protein [Alphaproteobacteria bacterium]